VEGVSPGCFVPARSSKSPEHIWFWNISEQDVNLQKIRQEKNTEEKRLFADTLARSYEYVTIA